MNSREPAADAGQVRPDAASLLADPMAPHALRFLGIQKELAPALGVTGCFEDELGQLFMRGLGTLGPEAEPKFWLRLRCQFDNQPMRSRGDLNVAPFLFRRPL